MRKIQVSSNACQSSNEIEREKEKKIYYDGKTKTYSSLNKKKDSNKIEKAI